MKWIVELAHNPLTLVCVRTIFSGVAVGMQVATLVCSSTGMPPAMIREAPINHCAVTHGPLPPVGTNGQPVITCGLATVAIAMPLTVTRGNGTVGCACPPCAHITVAFVWSKNPGMLLSCPGNFSRQFVKNLPCPSFSKRGLKFPPLKKGDTGGFGLTTFTSPPKRPC